LASAGDDGLVRIWDPDTGRLRRSIAAFRDEIWNISFSPDGRKLFVTVSDKVIAYDLSTGKTTPAPAQSLDPLAIEMLKENFIRAGGDSQALFSPDGQTLAIGEGGLQVWDVQSKQLLTAFSEDEELSLKGMSYSPDGKHLVAVTVDDDVYAWDLLSKKREFFVSANTLLDTQVSSANDGRMGSGSPGERGFDKGSAISPDASQIALSNGSAIEVWNIKNARKIITLAQANPVRFPSKISYSQNGEQIYATLDRNHDLAVWDARTGALIRQLNLPKVDDAYAYPATALQGVLFARNNNDSKNYWIEIWNIETGQMTKLPIPVNGEGMEPLRFSQDGKFFAAGYAQERVFIWRVDTGDLVFVTDKGLDFDDFALSPDGKILATTSKGKITLWDLSRYSGAAFQAGFTPMPFSFTPTPTMIAGNEYPTETRQPTQVVQPLPLPTASAGMIDAQNASMLKLVTELGKGIINRINWAGDDKTISVSSSRGFYQFDSQTLKEATQFGREELWITDERLLPDGRTLVAGTTNNGRVQVWDTENKKLLVELPGTGQPVISPNGRWLVFVNGRIGLATWDLEKGQPGINLLGYKPTSVVISPDSRLVAGVQPRHSIRVWDLKTGVITNAVGGPETEITDLTFSPDGHFLLAAAGGSAWMWDVVPELQIHKTNTYQGELKDSRVIYEKEVTSVAINRDNSLIAVGTSEKNIRLYNGKLDQELGILTGLSSVPLKLIFNTGDSRLLSVDADGKITIWDVAQQKQIAVFHEFTGKNLGLIARSDGKISAWTQNTAWTFDARNGILQQSISIPADRILAVSPLGDLVSGYTPYKVSLYDAFTGDLKQTLPDEAEEFSGDRWWGWMHQFYGALFSQDGKRLITFGSGGIWAYSLPNGEKISHLQGETLKAAISADGEWLVASAEELYDAPFLIETQSMRKIFTARPSLAWNFTQYAISPDKRQMGMLRFGNGDPSRFELVDTSTGSLSGYWSPIADTFLTSLAFNPTGTLVAIGEGNGNFELIEISTLKTVATFQAHIGSVAALAFSSDGTSLISAGQDGIIKIWGLP
jgi:WD40 repeat protein